MTPIKHVLLEFLKTMLNDLKARKYSAETEKRIETLKKLIAELETKS